MDKAVLFSVNPRYAGLILSGKKTVEVRKTIPLLEPPFKGYIYCTKGYCEYPVVLNGLPYVCHNYGCSEILA